VVTRRLAWRSNSATPSRSSSRCTIRLTAAAETFSWRRRQRAPPAPRPRTPYAAEKEQPPHNTLRKTDASKITRFAEIPQARHN
jgi:hypothetical protein